MKACTYFSTFVAAAIFKVAFLKHFASLDAETLSFVKTFVVGRLEDAAMVVESLVIVSHLAKNVSESELLQICLGALLAVKRQRFGIEPRLSVFSFVNEQLKRLPPSKDLFDTFLNAVADEKDPRNLIQIFEIVPQLALTIQDESDLEELFESISCYFPITFRATPSDPRLVSVDSLKAALARALSCPSFASEAMIFTLAKLSSASNAAKLDSLELLYLASGTFPSAAFESKAYELKIVIFSEIVSNPEPKIQQSALKLLKSLCALLRLTCDFQQKFLNEALSAVQLGNNEIIAKAAVMIEAVASSSQSSFELALECLLMPLVQLAKSEETMKAQVSRNCLVALLSPLKNEKSWIKPKLSALGPSLLANLSIPAADYGVFLVIYSFVSAVIEPVIATEFLEKCFNKLAALAELPLDLKNCLWLASKSQQSAFEPFICGLSAASILASIASTPLLTKLVIVRLLEVQHLQAIQWVIENSDLSETCQEAELALKVCKLGLSVPCLIKFVSCCPAQVQILCFSADLPISPLIVACEGAVLESQFSVIRDSLSFLLPEAVCSLSNKLRHAFSFDDSVAIIACLRGRLWRGDTLAIEELKALCLNADLPLLAMIESCSAPKFTSSSTTHHVKKSLWAQKFLSQWLPFCSKENRGSLAVLFSVLSVAPQIASILSTDLLLPLLVDFLSWSDEACIPVDVRCASWDLFGILFKAHNELGFVIDLCLSNCSVDSEKSCLVRMKALQILSKLVEEPQLRFDCRPFQMRVCLALKKKALADPKRVVRREAAKCRNLWLVAEEDGIFE